MSFDALDAEDYALGQAMAANYPSGLPSWSVTSYPDSIPAGTMPRDDNGWSVAGFTSALGSVASSITDVAKTVWGLENTANAMSLQRLQTASAIDVARYQTATARDVAIAQQAAESLKARAILAQSEQAARINAQLAAGGSSNTILLVLVGVGVWMFMRSQGQS